MKSIFLFMLAAFCAIFYFFSCELEESTDSESDPEASTLLFPGTKSIKLRLPAHNDTVYQDLKFSWWQTGRRDVFVGVFDTTIFIKDNQIVNRNNNIWAWHTGLGTGREGLVEFSQGRDVINGVIQIEKAPTPLIKGKKYYWAVWAWDEGGKIITHSSAVWYFWIG